MSLSSSSRNPSSLLWGLLRDRTVPWGGVTGCDFWLYYALPCGLMHIRYTLAALSPHGHHGNKSAGHTELHEPGQVAQCLVQPSRCRTLVVARMDGEHEEKGGRKGCLGGSVG